MAFDRACQRFIVNGCSDSKLTRIFGICMLSSPGSPKFKTLGQGFHENGLSYMGHSKNEILGENPLTMTWIEDFPCLIRNFSICYNIILVVSPDGFNSNLKNFFWTTHSHVVQEHPGMNEFCSNVRFAFWVRVVLEWEKYLHHQLFTSYLSTNKAVSLAVLHHMSLLKN